jgi:hypothetical protein
LRLFVFIICFQFFHCSTLIGGGKTKAALDKHYKMQKKFLILSCVLIFTILIGCENTHNPCSLSEAVLKDVNTIDSFINIQEIQDRDMKWMVGSYREPSIFHVDNETYRFIRSTSFNGTEVYRVERDANAFKAVVKTFGQGDTVGKFTEFNISKEIWDNITDSLNETNFWIYPSLNDKEALVLDGETWLLEGYKPTKDKCTQKNYHRIQRSSPIETKVVSMYKLFSKLKPR